MKDFNKGGRSFGGGNDRPRNSFGGGDRGGRSFGGDRGGNRFGNDRPNPQMHNAICSECGNKCEVPFRPTGDKPVFCNNCFASKRDGDTRSFDKPRHDDRGDRGDRSHGFDQKPAFSKPAGDDKRIDELKRQVDMINTKLDSLIKMVTNVPFPTAVPAKAESLKKMVEKIQAPATVKTKAKSVEKPLAKTVAKPTAKPVVKTTTKKAPTKTVAKPVKKVAPKKKK